MTPVARETLNKARVEAGLHPHAKRGRRPGLDVKFGRRDMAFIYELRQEGIAMSVIAEFFEINPSWLSNLVNRCMRDGLDWLKKP